MIDLCESSGFLHALYIAIILFKIVCVVVPLILIFMLSLDVYKIVMDPNNTKKVIPYIVKRLLAALIIFFVPTVVTLVSNMFNKTEWSNCLRNASNYSSYSRK